MSTIMSIRELENLTINNYINIEYVTVKNVNSNHFNIICQLSNLKRLQIMSHTLKMINGIGQLTHLRDLKIQCGCLKELSNEIGNLTELQILVLSENQLETIPPVIKSLTKLKKLSLNKNRLVSLPNEIGELINIVEINLSNNHLIYFPNTFGNLQNLVIFDAQYMLSHRYDKELCIVHCNDNAIILDYDLYHSNKNNIIDNLDGIKHLIIYNAKNKQIDYLPNTLEHLQIYFLNSELINLPPRLDRIVLYLPLISTNDLIIPYGCELIVSVPLPYDYNNVD